MNKLSDILKNRKSTVNDDTVEGKSELSLYNDNWLLKMSNATGFIINSDGKKVKKILGALNRKGGHCPCGGNGDQFLCPCINMRDKGICKCGLFENVTHVNPSGISTGRINKMEE